MSPETVSTWVGVLREGGGWALSVVEAGVIWYLWRELKAKDLRLFGLLDKTNDILLAIHRLATGGRDGGLPPSLPPPQ
jgi:hypothetical protein